jgi:hypothetical protein
MTSLEDNYVMDDVEPITPLKAQLFEALRLKLQGYDFVLDLKHHKFLRKRGDVTDHFRLPCKDASPGYRVQPSIGVRLNRVEEIFHQTSGFDRKDQANTSTWGTSAAKLIGGRTGECEFSLVSASQVEHVSEQIMNVFREYALPFYERWGSLKAIDAAVNAKPEERVLYRSLAWFRCSTGLITARLTGRADYEKLLQTYTEIMKKDNKGFYFKWFEPLTKSLEEIPPGSGLAA